MMCTKCGAELHPNALFCSFCGTPVPIGQPQGQPQGWQQPTQQNQQVHYDCGIQRREIATALLLSIFTLGIYGIYWFIKMVDDVNRAANDQTALSGGVTWLLSLLTGGIFGVYWYYQAGKKMNYAKQVRNMPVESSTEILYLLLAIFGLGIVNKCLIQNDLNQMV